MSGSVTVTFEPGGVTVAVPAGTTVLEASRRAGIPLPSTCGGRGTCGECAVRVLAGAAAPPSVTESAALRSAPPDVRLACMLAADSPLTVRAIAPVARYAGAPARAAPPAVSLAIDLGTTSISAAALDASGREVAAATVANPQRAFGADVASRVTAAIRGRADELRALAVRGMDEALAATGSGLAGVERVVVAANTAMTHLAVGAEASGLAEHPYAGSLAGLVSTDAEAVGLLDLPSGAPVVFLPPMAAFVGGDTTAAVLATGLDSSEGVHVLLDLGTNAEVVVSIDGELTVASCAAGPAFEAAGLACGTPAVPGAVRDVRLADERLELDVIGGATPASLCGSGALALVAALLEAGHLDATGRLRAEGPLASLVHRRGEIVAVQVAGEPGGAVDVYLTQLDVRELQLAKAAVATALGLTLEAAGAGWDDIEAVRLAGAFGAGLDARVLRALGVLPGEGPTVTGAGNAALAGAEMVAADPGLLARAESVAAGARGVDLAAHPAFHRAFIARMDLRPLP